MAAKTVPKTPIHVAALAALPLRKLRMSFGKTGAINASASMSSMTVTKMKAMAPGRDCIASAACTQRCSGGCVNGRSKWRRLAQAPLQIIYRQIMMPLSYRSPKTEVRESKIHGHGLFATADIAKDEVVAVEGGHIVDRKTLREQITPRLGPVEIQIDDDLFIALVTDDEREMSMLYSNHSCNANLGVLGEITF